MTTHGSAAARHDAGRMSPPPGCPAHAAGAGPMPLSGPRFHTEPASLYREMRHAYGPVVPVSLPGDVPAWLVIGYREMMQVTGDPALFPRDSGLWNQWETLPEDWPLRPMVNVPQPSVYYTVGAEHQRHLRMLEPALEGVSPFELRRHTEQLADRLIDAFCAGGEADLTADFARPLPALVLGRILGFSDPQALELVRLMAAFTDGGPDALAAHQRFGAMMSQLLATKRERPGADVTSRMLASPIEFTDQEYILDLMSLTAAGHIPTSDWIGNSIRLMLTDDRFSASLGGGRHSVAEAMNEVLWEDTPTQILAGRWASRDCQLGGCRISAGDMLLLGLAAANGDPDVHDATNERSGGMRNGNSAHFSFSHGEFQCPFPAQEIAEVIARTAIEVLLDRLPDIDLDVPAETLVRRPSAFLRGMTVLPVRFSPTPAAGG
ncbi:cytochrome P450 [Streptomyces sp. SM12]|uniref:cytochrome P450 n=1 Tax=unclassified Streptomyces TaxID=2593676 RepID=UPI0035B5CFA4